MTNSKFCLEIANPLKSLMPEVGFEPTWARGPGDFESPASTSFTTPAKNSIPLDFYKPIFNYCQWLI